MANTRELSQQDLVELNWLLNSAPAELSALRCSLGSAGGGGGYRTDFDPGERAVEAATRAGKVERTLRQMRPEHERTLREYYGPRPLGIRSLYLHFGDLAKLVLRTRVVLDRAVPEASVLARAHLLRAAYDEARTAGHASPSYCAELVLRADARLPREEDLHVPAELVQRHVEEVLERAIGKKGGDPVFVAAALGEAVRMQVASVDDYYRAKGAVRGASKARATKADSDFIAFAKGA